MTAHDAQARSYSRTASAATKRAERDAHRAQEFYTTAAQRARMAARLTRDPARWLPQAGYTPSALESEARSFVRIADVYLRRSFSATDSAAFYRRLAASYRQMHARQLERMAS